MKNKNRAKAKPKHFKKAMARLIKYSGVFLLPIIISLIAIIAATILQIITPDKISDITNEMQNGIFGNMNFDLVISAATIVVIYYISSALLNILQNYIMSSVTHKLTHKMRRDLSKKVNKLPLKYFDATSHGDTISRFINDVDVVGQTLSQSIASFVGSVVLFIGSLFMMIKTNPLMALTAVLSSIIGFILTAFIMAKSQKYFVSQQAGIGEMNGYIEEKYSNLNVITAYNANKESIEGFKVINKNLYKSAWKSQFLSGLMGPLMGFIGNLGYLSIVVVGALLVSNGSIEIGVIFAFMMYVNFFSNSLVQVGQAGTNFQRTAASSERIFELLDEKELEDDSMNEALIENVTGNVEFKNVKFGYEVDTPIIHNFSAKIKSGQKVAIVGPTGAGKTTIVNLLMRFYEIESGEILIDGINSKETTRKNIHDQFCMVLQDTWLFEGTVYDNIVYSEENISREDVIKACEKLGIDHFIRTLPEGYDTVLNEKTSFSEGQKQIITIARAMIKNAPLLILDEATSSVDTRSELIVQRAMDELMKGRTSFIIAHRLSTIKNADLILVMKQGDIVEKGNHDELLKENGFYAELYNSQFEE